MIDQIGGWSSDRVGEQYGYGFSLKNVAAMLRQIVIRLNDGKRQ